MYRDWVRIYWVKVPVKDGLPPVPVGCGLVGLPVPVGWGLLGLSYLSCYCHFEEGTDLEEWAWGPEGIGKDIESWRATTAGAAKLRLGDISYQVYMRVCAGDLPSSHQGRDEESRELHVEDWLGSWKEGCIGFCCLIMCCCYSSWGAGALYLYLNFSTSRSVCTIPFRGESNGFMVWIPHPHKPKQNYSCTPL